MTEINQEQKEYDSRWTIFETARTGGKTNRFFSVQFMPATQDEPAKVNWRIAESDPSQPAGSKVQVQTDYFMDTSTAMVVAADLYNRDLRAWPKLPDKREEGKHTYEGIDRYKNVGAGRGFTILFKMGDHLKPREKGYHFNVRSQNAVTKSGGMVAQWFKLSALEVRELALSMINFLRDWEYLERSRLHVLHYGQAVRIEQPPAEPPAQSPPSPPKEPAESEKSIEPKEPAESEEEEPTMDIAGARAKYMELVSTAVEHGYPMASDEMAPPPDASLEELNAMWRGLHERTDAWVRVRALRDGLEERGVPLPDLGIRKGISIDELRVVWKKLKAAQKAQEKGAKGG